MGVLCNVCRRVEDSLLIDDYFNHHIKITTEKVENLTFFMSQLKKEDDSMFLTIENKYFKSYLYDFKYLSSFESIKEQGKCVLFSISFLTVKTKDELINYLITIDEFGRKQYFYSKEMKKIVYKRDLIEILSVFYSLISSHIGRCMLEYVSNQVLFMDICEKSFNKKEIDEMIMSILQEEESEIEIDSFIEENLNTHLSQEYVRRLLINKYFLTYGSISTKERLLENENGSDEKKD